MKRSVLALSVVVVLTLVLSGCGGGGTTTAKTDAAQPTPTKTSQTNAQGQNQTNPVVPVTNGAEKLITIEDVEKITGYKGVKTVARNSTTGAGGDVNFVNADGKLILMVLLSSDSMYARSKEAAKEYLAGETSGLGDEGVWISLGKMSPEIIGVMVKKKTQVVQVSTFLALGEKDITGTYVKKDKLSELVKIALSRM